ncbi:MAG: ABC transporter ATP-binding protein [Alphaproteobacteria bacterium]
MSRTAALRETDPGPYNAAQPPVLALEVEDVSHSYGARKALDGVSLSVESGQFTALLGPNGAGKSTLFSLITRLFAARQGSIRILGTAIDRNPGAALARIGVVFQARTLDLDLSVLDNLRYHAALHGIGPREARARSRAVLRDAGLADRARDPVRKLSGGQMRRLEVARALLHRPSLLLLDEPTVGLDVASKSAILAHVRDLVREHGVAVLWATHLLDEVEPEDSVFILNKGRVVAQGEAGAIVRQSRQADLRDAFTALTMEAA